MKVEDYLLRFDESTGDISLEVSENSNTDYIAQYTITKGEFKIVDNDTSEVLLTSRFKRSKSTIFNKYFWNNSIFNNRI